MVTQKQNLQMPLGEELALNRGQYGPPVLAPTLASYLQIGTEFEENEAFRR